MTRRYRNIEDSIAQAFNALGPGATNAEIKKWLFKEFAPSHFDRFILRGNLNGKIEAERGVRLRPLKEEIRELLKRNGGEAALKSLLESDSRLRVRLGFEKLAK